MKFHARKWLDFNVITKVVFFVLLVSSANSYPRSRAKSQKQITNQEINENDFKIRIAGAEKTLNSKPNSANAKKIVNKPVFNDNNTSSYRSGRYLGSEKNALQKMKKNKDSSRQSNIPFVAVPSNWVATFEPSNAVILASKVPLRIWAIGSVAKFPSFLEKIVQRIQSFYSTYKYQDLSRPAAQSIISTQYHQYDPEITVTNESSENLGLDTIESIDEDTIEEDSTEIETETPFPDFYETTTDLNYIDLDEIISTETSIEITP